MWYLQAFVRVCLAILIFSFGIAAAACVFVVLPIAFILLPILFLLFIL